jgi:hypothetical protein
MKKSKSLDLTAKKTVALVPFRDYVHPLTEDCLDQLAAAGYAVTRRMGVSAIDAARNDMAQDAVDAGFERLLFIDSDMVFKPADVAALEAHDLPIVCGAYIKKDMSGFAHQFAVRENVWFGAGGQLIEARAVGMGFTMITATALAVITEKCRLKYYLRHNGQIAYPWFMPTTAVIEGLRVYRSEDYSFCDRAVKAGFKIMCDTSLILGHVGQRVYTIPDLGKLVVDQRSGGEGEAQRGAARTTRGEK